MAVDRVAVTEAFRRALRGEAGRQQQLKQVQLPQDLYTLARQFTLRVPLRDAQQVLLRFVALPMLYTLLSETVGKKGVEEGDKEIGSLQEASKALLRYPMNLLLAPNRPEFRRLTVSCV